MRTENSELQPTTSFELVRSSLAQALPELQRYARAMSPPGVSPDDLVQSTFARALLKAEHYRTTGSVMGWLIVIMRNLMRDERRKGKRHVEYVRAQARFQAHTPAGQMVQLEVRDMVRAFEELNPNQQRVLDHIVFEGRSYEQAAAAEGVQVGTIRSRASRARELLKQATTG